MQISCHQLFQTQQQPKRRKPQAVAAPVTSVADLAAPDLQRERRIAELVQRIGEGSYQVDAEQVLVMTERRAQADRAAEL